MEMGCKEKFFNDTPTVERKYASWQERRSIGEKMRPKIRTDALNRTQA
jgi:hypothetical protein